MAGMVSIAGEDCVAWGWEVGGACAVVVSVRAPVGMGLEAVWALPPALQVAPPYPRGNSDGACPGLMTDWSVMPTAARSAVVHT